MIMAVVIVCGIFSREATRTVKLTDGADTVKNSIRYAVFHTGSRGGGLVGSANALAFLPRIIPYTAT